MTLFEFLMVLVSIIVGLGVAEILTGIAQQLRCRQTSTGYWLHSCGVMVVFLALLQSWWELWDLHDTQEWHFYGLVLMLIAPASLYLIAHLIFPEPVRNSDFRKYYYGAMRPIWWLAVLATVSSTLFHPIAFGSDFVNWDNATSLVLFVGFIVLASTRVPAIHSILVPTFLVLLIWDIVRWHPTFSAV
jgi:hypothetical protein